MGAEAEPRRTPFLIAFDNREFSAMQRSTAAAPGDKRKGVRMKIRPQDLVAAASSGLLQRKQIGPLLVFLLQRDVHAKRIALAAQMRTAQRNGLWRLLSRLVMLLAVVTTALFAMLLLNAHAVSGAAVFVFSLLYTSCATWFVMRLRKRPVARRVRTLPVLALMAVPLAMLVAKQVAI